MHCVQMWWAMNNYSRRLQLFVRRKQLLTDVWHFTTLQVSCGSPLHALPLVLSSDWPSGLKSVEHMLNTCQYVKKFKSTHLNSCSRCCFAQNFASSCFVDTITLTPLYLHCLCYKTISAVAPCYCFFLWSNIFTIPVLYWNAPSS